MEQLLHYLWKYRLYRPSGLTTTQGDTLEIIDPGLENTDAGPDFFNAKIRINGTVWAGSVEIHQKASDWLAHGHSADKAYGNVILHVVETDDGTVFRQNGEAIPQLVLPVPEQVIDNMEWLLTRDSPVACLERLPAIDPVFRLQWMDALLAERLERKTDDILRWLDLYQKDWNEVFYILLCRNFGFGVNSDAFERLARSLPLKCILKQRPSASQVEALFLGQAGLLNDSTGNRHHYYRLLQQEYSFLRKKYGLEPLEPHIFRNLRLRPDATPHIKLVELAAIWIRHDTLFSSVLSARTPRELKDFFRVPASAFWDTHYNFLRPSPHRKKQLGENALNMLLINTVVPLMFAYGLYHRMDEHKARALRLLASIPPEQNSIISLFSQVGMKPRNAGDTQALIQLKRNYCEQKKCLYCRLGFQLLKP
ncbi:DUF2851 family protein [Parabacteroides sp. AD58]|uniref:DUF2851 family protein n=1 Tax=Parabacteroides absconsus TaxID=2951805 RepID=A0ABZ2IR80_9BACT|nr:DUF2851 family protein [Parabacteroides sp. AD58]MCM6901525.1 DUF2851 family protein [Parabacteroides sp. AD58]